MSRVFVLLGCLLLGAAAVAAEDEAGKTSDKKTKTVLTVKKLKNKVSLISANLGHENFRIRKKATFQLIMIGKGAFSAKDQYYEAKSIVLEAMDKLIAAKDPEIAFRAKKVKDAIDPPPPMPHQREPVVIEECW